MTRLFGMAAVLGVLCLSATVHAQMPDQMPEMKKPTKEHDLLKQFAGEWETAIATVPAPGQESLQCKGKESAKIVGGFWLVSESEADMMGMPVASLLTIGYDPEVEKYVGTFVCSVDCTLWTYKGTMDESGKKLTLETKGPSCFDPTKTANYREVLQLKDPDHKTFTSYVQSDDGKWLKIVTVDYRRKK